MNNSFSKGLFNTTSSFKNRDSLKSNSSRSHSQRKKSYHLISSFCHDDEEIDLNEMDDAHDHFYSHPGAGSSSSTHNGVRKMYSNEIVFKTKFAMKMSHEDTTGSNGAENKKSADLELKTTESSSHFSQSHPSPRLVSNSNLKKVNDVAMAWTLLFGYFFKRNHLDDQSCYKNISLDTIDNFQSSGESTSPDYMGRSASFVQPPAEVKSTTCKTKHRFRLFKKTQRSLPSLNTANCSSIDNKVNNSSIELFEPAQYLQFTSDFMGEEKFCNGKSRCYNTCIQIQVAQAFKNMDLDFDNKLTFHEFNKGINHLLFTNSTTSDYNKTFFKSHSNQIRFKKSRSLANNEMARLSSNENNFLSLSSSFHSSTYSSIDESVMQKLFLKFDLNNDGYIDFSKWRSFFFLGPKGSQSNTFVSSSVYRRIHSDHSSAHVSKTYQHSEQSLRSSGHRQEWPDKSG